MFKIYQPDPGPERIGDILGRLFTQRGWGRRSARQQLEAAWETAAGEQYANHSRVLLLKKGVLEVEVNDAVLMQEMSSFHRRKLLDKMKKALPTSTIKELKFRPGTFS